MANQDENQASDHTGPIEILVDSTSSNHHFDHSPPTSHVKFNEKSIPECTHPIPAQLSSFYLQDNGTMSSTMAPSSNANLASLAPATRPGDPSSSITLEQKRDLLITLGQSLLNYGSPSYRVENGLKLTAAKLNLKITFTFTPESLMMTAIRKPATATASKHDPKRNQQHQHRHSKYKKKVKTSQQMARSSIYHHTSPPMSNISLGSTNHGSHHNKHHQGHHHNKRKTEKQQPWIILLNINITMDNAKLGQITKLMHRFYTDDPTLTFDDCLYQLKHDIIAAPATCGPWARILASTMAAFAASIIMFEGSWIDSGFSALFGLVIGGLKELANWMPVYARVFEVSACTLASLAVRSLHNYCCFNATIISSIIILLPGYAMTMAVMEITSKHMVAGAVRLIHVVFYSFLLAYGLELGSYLYDAFYPNTSTDGYCPVNNAPYSPVVPPEWAIIPLFPVMTCGLSMTFGSAPRQWPSEIIAAALGFGATYFLRRFIPDPPILNAISSFLVGLYGHVALKLTGQPPISPISVGVSMLVPGSIGVRGAFGMLHQSEEGKSNFALQMLNIAIGLSVGLFASGMVIYPAGKRRSLYISL